MAFPMLVGNTNVTVILFVMPILDFEHSAPSPFDK